MKKAVIYILDRYQVSLKAYHELSQIASSLPRTYTLESKQKEIGSEFEISSTPGDQIGAQSSLLNELQQDKRLLSQSNKVLVSLNT